MRSTRKYNKGVTLLLCVIDIYNKYVLVVLLKKGEKGITTTNAFQKVSMSPVVY